VQFILLKLWNLCAKLTYMSCKFPAVPVDNG